MKDDLPALGLPTTANLGNSLTSLLSGKIQQVSSNSPVLLLLILAMVYILLISNIYIFQA